MCNPSGILCFIGVSDSDVAAAGYEVYDRAAAELSVFSREGEAAIQSELFQGVGQ